MFNSKVKDLDELFPIYRLEDGILLSYTGELTAGFKLIFPEIFIQGEKQLENLHATWTKLIRLLPEGYILHKQDRFLKKQVDGKGEVNPEVSGISDNYSSGFLESKSKLFFHEREYLSHDTYLFVCKRTEGKPLGNSAFSNLLRSSLPDPALLSEAVYEKFNSLLGQCQAVLTESGIQVKRLVSEDYTGHLGAAGLLEQYILLNGNASKGLLSDVSFHPDLKIGEQEPLVFSLADVNDLPNLFPISEEFEPYSSDRSAFILGLTAPISHLLPCNHIYNQFIIAEDKNKVLKNLESRRLRFQSLSAYSRENAIAADAMQDYLNEAISQGRTPVKAHFNLICWGEGKRELQNMTAAALTKMNIIPKLETQGAGQLYWAGIPGNEAALPVNETFDCFADIAACLINSEGAYHSSPGTFGVRLGDRLYGKPLLVDISDEPMQRGWITNRNKFVLGPSGSGKSFFTNHMVRSYVEHGAHVVLVDVGHSYRGLCELLKGYYFTYEEDHPISFNPFVLRDGKLDTEKKESLKTLLLALWKKDDETFTRSEYVAISNALKSYYAFLENKPELFPCFNTFYEFLVSDFSLELEELKVSQREFDLNNFLYVLRPFYRTGEFDYLLNATENLDLLDQPLIVFELDNIKDHPILFPVVTLIIMEIFISKMRQLKGIRKMILIEEAWKAIAKEGMAEYIKYLFKTVRKFFGEAVVVTQEVDDIISSPVVKDAIINNSDCKILLDQSKYQNKFHHIQDLLGLTDREKMQILSINKANDPKYRYKEVFIGLGPVGKVYRTEVSPEEYLTYTTEEKERSRLDLLTKRYSGDRQRAIVQMAEDLKSAQR